MGDAIRRRIGFGLIAAAMAVASHAQAVELSGQERTFRTFTNDAATVEEGRIRLEVQGIRVQEEEGARFNLIGFRIPKPPAARREQIGMNGGIFNLLGSYGLTKNAEVGFLLPGYIESRTVVGQKRTKEDIGDLQLYGKFTQPLADMFRWGAGVEVSVPSGNESDDFGTGEVGLNPFVSGRFTWKRIGFGGHVGYQLSTGDVPDVFNTSGSLFLKGSDFYTLRAETALRVFQQGGFRNVDLTVWPGVDMHFSDRLIVRPTGMAGGTGAATDWGIALGIVYTL
jgi:hypothetical protein